MVRGFKLDEDSLKDNLLFDGVNKNIEDKNIMKIIVLIVTRNITRFKQSFIVDKNDIKYLNNVYYNKYSGYYIYLVGDETKYNILPDWLNHKDRFRYASIPYNYSSNPLVTKFNLHVDKTSLPPNKLKEHLYYSFGLEFETCEGVIPEYLCYSNGLIPLRDGSISGFEYSTIILGKTYGLQILNNQISTLKKFTKFNDDCALHIHFGKFKENISAIYILHKLCEHLQKQFQQILPEYTFNTGAYKSSGKQYNKLLPEVVNISDMINYYSDDNYNIKESEVLSFDLKTPHPSDTGRNHKWQIHSRYHWVNFINMLFYNNHKTIEFRFLKPSYNYNKIVSWIFIFTAILKNAELLYKKYGDCTGKDWYELIDKEVQLSLYNLMDIYIKNNYLHSYIVHSLENIYKETNLQRVLNDRIGSRCDLDDLVFTENIKI